MISKDSIHRVVGTGLLVASALLIGAAGAMAVLTDQNSIPKHMMNTLRGGGSGFVSGTCTVGSKDCNDHASFTPCLFAGQACDKCAPSYMEEDCEGFTFLPLCHLACKPCGDWYSGLCTGPGGLIGACQGPFRYEGVCPTDDSRCPSHLWPPGYIQGCTQTGL